MQSRRLLRTASFGTACISSGLVSVGTSMSRLTPSCLCFLSSFLFFLAQVTVSLVSDWSFWISSSSNWWERCVLWFSFCAFGSVDWSSRCNGVVWLRCQQLGLRVCCYLSVQVTSLALVISQSMSLFTTTSVLHQSLLTGFQLLSWRTLKHHSELQLCSVSILRPYSIHQCNVSKQWSLNSFMES